MNTNLSSKDILELAITKHKKQDLLEAEKLYQEVLNKDKNNFNANFLLGTLFASIKKFESAIIRLEKAKALNPNNADTHNNLGNVYKELNNIKFAKENYFLALKIDLGSVIISPLIIPCTCILLSALSDMLIIRL